MTYTEFCLTKTAEKTIPSDYALIQQRLAENNPEVTKAMNTPVAGEVGWGLLGAGLGAGGAYLLSRRLRRNGTKRQRALDIVAGALAGLVGSQLLLSGTDDTGLSVKQRLRADAFLDSIGRGDKDHGKEWKIEEPWDLNWRTGLGAGVGAPVGIAIGRTWSPLERGMVSHAEARALAKGQALAAKQGLKGSAADQFASDFVNKGPGRDSINSMRSSGKTLDTIFGGLGGAATGYAIGAYGNYLAGQEHAKEYGGVF